MSIKPWRRPSNNRKPSVVEQLDAANTRNLKLIVILQYALLVFSILASAEALYLLLRGPIDAFLLANNAVILAASGVSILYLFLHQLGAWRYCSTRHAHKTNDFHIVLDVGKALLGFAFIAWIAASVLGLMVASDSPFCVGSSGTADYWRLWSIDTCRIQKAGVAATLTALLTTLMLSWTLRTTDRVLEASLACIHHTDRDDEETFTLSPDRTWPSRKNSMIWNPSCDTVIHIPASGTQAFWLPQYNLETAVDDTHPALRRPMLSRSQSDTPSSLLPSPLPMSMPMSPITPYHKSLPPPPPLKRSHTADTACSSIYSRSVASSCSRPSSTSLSTRRSSRSSRPSTVSSDMDLTPLLQEPVPRIPDMYASTPKLSDLIPPALQIQPSRHAACPKRPQSRPRMPPAKFWEYARNEQQRRNYMRQQVPIAEPTGVLSRHRDSVIRHRRRMQSEGGNRSRSHSSSSVSPTTRILSPAANSRTSTTAVVGLYDGAKYNTMPTLDRGYEGVRKGYEFGSDRPVLAYAGRSVDFGIGFDADMERTSPGRRESRGRVLVKKRQPWDREPRLRGSSRG